MPVKMQEIFDRILVDHRLIRPGGRVLVALSGGPDSVALFDLLLQACARLNVAVHAAHLDHGMRGESATDAAFVARLCRQRGVALALERHDVPAVARQRRCGLEEAAREERRAFLQSVARREGCARIALGHHRDDQAETVLHRLLRGSGLSGLAAMRLRNGPFIRPLLLFSRREILSYLAARGLSYVEDASNGDPAFTRNRIRHELLPLLRTFNPRCDEHLARLSRRIAQEEDYWDAEVERCLADLSRMDQRGMWLARDKLLTLHPALRARVLRRALERVRGDLLAVGAVHLEALERLLTAGRSEAEAHLPGVWAARRYERLWLRGGPPPAAAAFALEVPGPGVYALPGGGELHVSIASVACGENRQAVEFDADSVAFPLLVRSLRPGDRFWPCGAPGRKKLKDFFIDAKLDREVRCRLPLVVADAVLWVVGVRRCHGRAARAGKAVLRLVVTGCEQPIERL